MTPSTVTQIKPSRRLAAADDERPCRPYRTRTRTRAGAARGRPAHQRAGKAAGHGGCARARNRSAPAPAAPMRPALRPELVGLRRRPGRDRRGADAARMEGSRVTARRPPAVSQQLLSRLAAAAAPSGSPGL